MNKIESNERGDVTGGQVSRRSAVMAASGAVGAFFASGLATAGEGTAGQHGEHSAPSADLLQAVHDCHRAAQTCLNHCLESFAAGDTMLAACAKSIVAMTPICEAFAVQVANQTKYLDELASVCRAACVDCEKECRKHAKHHSICKECADACAHLIAMIDKR